MKIDVSKCERYDNGNCDRYYDVVCEERNCMYKQLQQLKAENEEIRKVNNANAKLMVRLRDTLNDIEEQIEDIISEKCNKPCEKCTGKPLCDKYYILRKIKEVKENE